MRCRRYRAGSHSRRSVWRILATTALILVAGSGAGISASFFNTSVAAAAVGTPTCPHGGNTISVACFYGYVQYGDFTWFRNNTMAFTNPQLETVGQGHINQSIWAYSGSPCDAWIEMGLTQGFTNHYEYGYYAGFKNTFGYFHAQYLYTAPLNGTLHSYQLSYDTVGTTTYSAFLDGQQVFTINNLGYGTCTAEAGLEVSGGMLATAHTSTFTLTPLEWQDTNGVWHVGWNTSQEWVTKPCYLQGYAPPNCMNGLYYRSDFWADNAPT